MGLFGCLQLIAIVWLAFIDWKLALLAIIISLSIETILDSLRE